MIIKKKILILFSLTTLMFLLVGCSGKSAEVLEVGVTYIGDFGTSEIIVVDELDQWTIKNRHKDDTNYTVARIIENEEKIDNYSVFKIVGEEIYGKDTVFAKREGEDYIVTEDEERIYFTRIRENNKNEIIKGLKESENPNEYAQEKAKFIFKKQ